MYALEIKDLKKTYKNGFTALKGIDVIVEQGDFFALLGPNGAGKSTTIGVISSLVNKTSGTVKVFGHDVDKELSKAKLHTGVVAQEFNFDQFEKVINIVLNQAGFYGIPRNIASKRAEHYLRSLGLWEKRFQAARNLSGGMKRRLMIVRALVTNPKLLLLDEPTAGVDIELRRGMWDFLQQINKEGTTIILTTHYLEEAELLCRNIAIIDHGEIIRSCPMAELLKDLNFETYLIETSEPLNTAPVIEGYDVRLTDNPKIMEVDIKQGESINDIFTVLSKQHIDVLGMRSKSNRLEELFIQLTGKHEGPLKESE